MNSKLTPTFTQQVGDNYFILWFKTSNQYTVIDQTLMVLLKSYLGSRNKSEFNQTLLQLEINSDKIDAIYQELDLFLQECNVNRPKQVIPDIQFNSSHRNLTRYYLINKTQIEIHYASEDLKKLIHPQIEHLSLTDATKKSDFVFDIYIKNHEMCLFKDQFIIGSYPLTNYHLLQGKFAMELVCSLNNNNESDWLGTFHASTVEQNNKGVMLIGDSGSGKSTFTALLTANGFNLVADDITPIMFKDQKVYGYPAAISIKSGAFETLDTLIPEFSRLKEVYINPYKGYVKYLPPNNLNDITKGYNCETIVVINYNKNQKDTLLEPIEIAEALNILIPESWLEPSERNAKQFLNWLQKLKCYKLSYSNNNEAINKFSELF